MARPPGPDGLEAQRVFAKVAQSMLGIKAELPTIGRFEVRERIGAGGMGQVYGAYDPDAERDVAIKILRADHRADRSAVSRMQREARALTRLDHPNVVEVYEVGTVDQQVYIAMERLRGQDLRARLRQQGRLSPAETFAALGDVCRALQRAHNRGIIHRDLKPANIFLAEASDATVTKVLDFGLAKVHRAGTLDISTASGTVMGTLHYMSPEQGRDSTAIDHRCDLWAVAIIAYECLVGRRPFEGETMAELAVALLTESPPVPSEHGDVPAGFDAWFAKATARALEQRFDSAAAMADALADALGQPRVRGLERPARSSRRRRWLAAAAAAAIASGAFVLVARGGAPELRPSSSAPETPASSPETPARSDAIPGTPGPSDVRSSAARAPLDAGPPELAREPVPPTVELRVEGVPEGATFWVGDSQVGVAPAPAVLVRSELPQQVRIEAAGFEALVLEVVADRSIVQSVELTVASPRARSIPTTKGPSTHESPRSNVDDLEF